MYELTIEQYTKLEEALSQLDALHITGLNNFTLVANAGVRLQYVLQKLKKQEIIVDNKIQPPKREVK